MFLKRTLLIITLQPFFRHNFGANVVPLMSSFGSKWPLVYEYTVAFNVSISLYTLFSLKAFILFTPLFVPKIYNATFWYLWIIFWKEIENGILQNFKSYFRTIQRILGPPPHQKKIKNIYI